jgi:5'-nucleotidase
MDLAPPPERGIFCNRTLNLRAIEAVGYDMDYTLVHYRVEAWERHAYEHLRRRLASLGWPVEGLRFDPELMVRGLIIDLELGNIVKANRFGYVKLASHGTRTLSFEEVRRVYALTPTDLATGRFAFINTFFSLSEICMYAQLVDLLDEGEISGISSYAELAQRVRQTLDEAHWEGQMKAEILADPERFIELDPDTPLALLDQLRAGKKLMLITNSEWGYARSIMEYAFNPFLPKGMRWRDLFELVVVSARKPSFFSAQNPIFRLVDEQGWWEPVPGPLPQSGIYLGGNAATIEQYLGLSGDRILYVGDHIFVDVNVSKKLLQWRTALVLRELEHEVRESSAASKQQRELDERMSLKEALERELCQLRLLEQRRRHRYGPVIDLDEAEIASRSAELRGEIQQLDERISPLARRVGQLCSERWGPLMRTGRDKSHLARQVERYADIYTSRVSNFLFRSPFVYFQSPRGSLPHDPLSG